ncbi:MULTISPECIES: hypothetical protein [Sphingomonas]|nr:hypothetical protein [Sphingomonas trueperi]
MALIVGFGAGFALRPVLAPMAAPATVADTGRIAATSSAGARSQQYFAAHIEEARQVVAGCQSGSVRGDECFNAGQAVIEADGRARFNKFFGH